MSWSFPIATIRGTVVRVHFTFLLFLVWIAFAHYTDGGARAALEGVTFILLLFFCVLLHEFGHILTARRYGVQTPQVVLLPIGGVAHLERIPEKPSQELMIAAAGPLVNVVIAGLLLALLGGRPPAAAMELQDPRTSLLAQLAIANIFLVVFNLIPAFPMDGGRMLRALLAYRLGFARATHIAATVGQGFAFLLGLWGLLGNPMLLFIAFFVYLGAASEAYAVQMREATRNILAADAAVTHFESLSPLSDIEQAVQALIHTTQTAFPVVDGGGRLRGVLTRDGMIRALRDNGPQTPVMEAMIRDIPLVNHRTSLTAALRLLQERRLPAIGVEDGAGRLVGLITPENIGEMMMVQAARDVRQARGSSGGGSPGGGFPGGGSPGGGLPGGGSSGGSDWPPPGPGAGAGA